MNRRNLVKLAAMTPLASVLGVNREQEQPLVGDFEHLYRWLEGKHPIGVTQSGNIKNFRWISPLDGSTMRMVALDSTQDYYNYGLTSVHPERDFIRIVMAWSTKDFTEETVYDFDFLRKSADTTFEWYHRLLAQGSIIETVSRRGWGVFSQIRRLEG